MKISIIIPVLNEREDLPPTLDALMQWTDIHEIIIVDGGSTDGTREWLSRLLLPQNVRFMEAMRGRGNQINAGAKAASGDVCLFLHADTRLPADALTQITACLKEAKTEGGAFLLRFREARPWTLRAIENGINFRTRLLNRATGDQAIFCRRSSFEKTGGYPDWPVFEDVEFVTRLRRAGRFAIIASHVTTSARRYIAWGVLRTTALMFALQAAYWCGVSPFRLQQWYRDVRRHL